MSSVSTGPRVLIVEDHADTADILSRYARLLNCDTRIARSGREAGDVAADFLPQIILLDIGLPDDDGWQVAKVLRDKLEPVRPVMIAVTGRGSPEDRLRSGEAGFDYHLTKPSFREDLMRILMRLVGTS